MRIAIVNHNSEAVERLRSVILQEPVNEIAWIASDGVEAIKKCKDDVPDLILMKLDLPGINGVETTREIMQNSPCAILIVTSAVKDNKSKVFEAMGYGALDVATVSYPAQDGSFQGKDTLLAKLGTVRKLIGEKRKEQAKAPDRGEKKSAATTSLCPLVVIGSSTGGPKALAEIFSRLPADFKAGVVVVQHINEQFSTSLVEWLDSQTPLSVALAENGTEIKKGVILIAGTSDHLVLKPDMRLRYITEPKDNPYRPSVDIFFQSVLKNNDSHGVAVLLTGMGADGAQGMKALSEGGWHTIAQDKKSSVVFGMPKAAVEIGAAKEILPLKKIPAAIISYLNQKY